MKIVEINRPNLKDVPKSMRMLAELIESGKEPNSTHAIVVSIDENHDIHIYEYGASNTIEHAIGVLWRVITKLSNYLEDKEHML